MRELIGYFEYEIPKNDRLLLVNLSLETGINLSHVRETEERVCFRLPVWCATAFEGEMRQKGVLFLKSSLKGFFGVCKRLARHPGMCVGLILALAMYVWIAGCVWEVRIACDSDIDEDIALSYLAESGLKEGARIWRLDPDSVASEYLLRDTGVSFVAVHLNGVIAEVEIIPLEVGEGQENTAPPCNIVAEKAAVVTDMTVYSGTPKVKVGQTVKAGDLLVSGVATDVGGTRILSARADVYGQVTESLSVLLPWSHTERQVLSRKTVGISLSFFGLEVTLGKKQGDISSSGQAYLFGLVRLPIRYTLSVAQVETKTSRLLTTDEASRLAETELLRQLSIQIGEGMLVSRTVKEEAQEEGLLVTWEVVYEGNIGKALAFETENG